MEQCCLEGDRVLVVREQIDKRQQIRCSIKVEIGYVCKLRRWVVRVWAQTACRASSQSGKHYPWNPTAFEGMPTDGLPAGIVCLSPTLAGSLRDADVVHVAGNMEDEGLNILQYFPPKGWIFSGCPFRRL